ncbi:conserved hypothetical protein, secreted [Candidatus Desulfofervidus auxilii]|uniref:DUF3617 family protein n=1 Tax=Desulfofervidus auxilii TaxID=1621989 RepID=A0A7U4TJ13_DESA2|nr:DUF3617 family protein [Candidatus Desulfofervidus auxilii]AMM41995.1 conserved hypothetical protein, secreted [Candidatus Desulfofervidus auxilii]
MVKKVCFVSMFAFLVLFLSNIAQAQNMKEGLWQITMTIEMPGMPMQMPPQTYTHCLTKKDMVPQKEEPNQECRMVKRDIEGDTVTWVMECKTSEGTAVFNGKVTYKGNSFEGIIKMKQSGMEMTQNLKGKWIGECK